MDPKRLRFLDQSNAKTNMTRLYGRAPRGKRVVDHVPDGRWESLTMMAVLEHDGTTIPMVYKGGTDISAMGAFVEHHLAPTLEPGDIVVMDNLSSHHNAEVVAAIEATGAEVWFLPRYSPDYNPIEQMWSKVKSHLRNAAARSEKALIRAIGQALEAITPQDAAGWFANAGYP